MLENASVTTFTISDLLRENQQECKIYPSPTTPHLPPTYTHHRTLEKQSYVQLQTKQNTILQIPLLSTRIELCWNIHEIFKPSFLRYSIRSQITDTRRHTSVENQAFGREKQIPSKSQIQHKKGNPSLGQKYGQK